MTDTVFALSSGSPPAAIAIIRITGPHAGVALARLCGRVPAPRTPALRRIVAHDGDVLDEALVLWFPGPGSATGEDCAEIHCHGARAIVAAVSDALADMDGLRPAEPGEFTRRAFANGRIDLAQAEALGDLLAAETELQRRVAQAGYGGALSRHVERWREETLQLSAMVEAVLDFSDEEDAGELPPDFGAAIARLRSDIRVVLEQPRAERLRDGLRVVLAGPPNSGKSSLFNVLCGESRAIVTPIAGTTRDVLECPVALDGVPLVLVDTAGLRDEGAEAVERIGIDRARHAIGGADIVLWLGPQGDGPTGAWEVQPRADDPQARPKTSPSHVVSSVTGEGVAALARDLAKAARRLLPKPGMTVLNARQATLVAEAADALRELSPDPLLVGESLRLTRSAFDRLTGRADVEDMLDSLFARFCIGK